MDREALSDNPNIPNSKAALERYRYLCAIVERKTIPADIIKICRSQSRLAAWSFPQRRIFPVSLNTLKAAADREIEDGGWAGLDGIRLKVSKIQRKSSISRVDRQAAEIKRLRNQLDESVRIRATLNRAYFDALTLLQAAVTRDVSLAAQLERHTATFGEALGLRVLSGVKDGE